MKKFDWHSERLTKNTIITDSYKNTQNVRRFFIANIGEHFHFTREFMKFMKQSSGKTLDDALTEWKKSHRNVQ